MDVLMSVSKQIKNKAVNLADTVGGTDLEKKVKAATSNENYPTPLSQLQEIANLTNDYSACREIMPLVWKRLGETKSYWRIIYKTLVLLRELIRFGSDRVLDETRDHMFLLRQLDSFRYQEDGKERGNGIREVSAEIIELINDGAKLRQVREEGARNRSKYTSQSSSGGSGGYGGGSTYGGYSGGSYNGSGGSYDDGPSNKYAGFGGGSDSYSSGGGSSSVYDEPKKSKKSHAEESNDDPYGESNKKSKSDKEKKSKKSKDRDLSPPAAADEANEDDDEKAAKKKKKASKRAKEAAEAAKANAPKIEGGKLAPPPGTASIVQAEAPDLFDPRSAAVTSTGGDDDFAAFTSAPDTSFQPSFPAATVAAPAPAPTNMLDALFDFDGAPPKPVTAAPASSSSFGFDFGGSSAPAASASSNNNWDAFASSTSSTANTSSSAGFDFLSAAPASNQRGKPQQAAQSDVFEAFQSSKPAPVAASRAAAAPASSATDAWSNDLVKLDLGSSKPTPAQGATMHIPVAKGADPFSHLIANQQRPMMMGGGMRPPMQGGMGMGMQQPMGGMGMQQQQMGGMGGFGMMPQQQQQMGGMGGMGGFGGMPQQQQPGFGFPQKKPDHNIFF